jgi:hypothetical protein
MIRILVACVAVCVGILVCAGEFLMTPALPPPQRGVAGQPSPEEFWLILVLTATFYGTVYLTGRGLYSLLGRFDEAERVGRVPHGLLAVLHVVGGVWLIIGGWQALGNALVVRPSLVLGLLLVGLSAWDSRHLLLRKRSEGDRTGESGLFEDRPPADA